MKSTSVRSSFATFTAVFGHFARRASARGRRVVGALVFTAGAAAAIAASVVPSAGCMSCEAAACYPGGTVDAEIALTCTEEQASALTVTLCREGVCQAGSFLAPGEDSDRIDLENLEPDGDIKPSAFLLRMDDGSFTLHAGWMLSSNSNSSSMVAEGETFEVTVHGPGDVVIAHAENAVTFGEAPSGAGFCSGTRGCPQQVGDLSASGSCGG